MSRIKSFVNLSNRDRSRIRWLRYHERIIWCLEFKDYDGQFYGEYVTSIDGDECSDSDLAWVKRMIDEWEVDREEEVEHDVEFDDDFDCDFAEPGSGSALRAASKDNPRNLPCPTCGAPNRLTPKDRALGYQCNECADRLERGF